MISRTFNGVTTQYAYDADGRVIQVAAGDGTVLYSYVYTGTTVTVRDNTYNSIAPGYPNNSGYGYQNLSVREDDGTLSGSLPTGDDNSYGGGPWSKAFSSVIKNAKGFLNTLKNSASRFINWISGNAPETTNDPTPQDPTPSSEGTDGSGSSGDSPQDEQGNSEDTGELVQKTNSINKNIENLRKWAQSKGRVRQDTAGGVEQWGVRNAEGQFSWRLKIKPQASNRPGLGAGSKQPRFDARLGEGKYINPFTGETGGRDVGTHIPLGG